MGKRRFGAGAQIVDGGQRDLHRFGCGLLAGFAGVHGAGCLVARVGQALQPLPPALQQINRPAFGGIELRDQPPAGEFIKLDPREFPQRLAALGAQVRDLGDGGLQGAVQPALVAVEARNGAVDAGKGLPSGQHRGYHFVIMPPSNGMR